MVDPTDLSAWDTYGMNLAKVVATKSKDPDTKVGCVILDADRAVVSTGYNGPPSGVDDTSLNLTRPTKYRYMRHAEANALTYADRSRLLGSTLYVTGIPCPRCMLDIIAHGIRRVVMGKQVIAMVADHSDTEHLAELWGVELVRING